MIYTKLPIGNVVPGGFSNRVPYMGAELRQATQWDSLPTGNHEVVSAQPSQC
jgi:hypothetical protein